MCAFKISHGHSASRTSDLAMEDQRCPFWAAVRNGLSPLTERTPRILTRSVAVGQPDSCSLPYACGSTQSETVLFGCETFDALTKSTWLLFDLIHWRGLFTGRFQVPGVRKSRAIHISFPQVPDAGLHGLRLVCGSQTPVNVRLFNPKDAHSTATWLTLEGEQQIIS